MKLTKFKLGLIVNPLAGIGGPVGLKGSDGDDIVHNALGRGGEKRASGRASTALRILSGQVHGNLSRKDCDYRDRIELISYPGPMGEESAIAAGFSPKIVGRINPQSTTSEDTQAAAKLMYDVGVDLLLFVGGDGTARDICRAVGLRQLTLGVPSGVKMHSGVYAISPQAAGDVVRLMIERELVSVCEQEVRDIDEEAFRQGLVKAKYYGELLVPEEGRFIQQVKQGGREVEELVLADIAAELIEQLEPETLYIVGPGTTTLPFMEQLGLESTLLGVDVVQDQQLVAKDIGGPALEALLEQHTKGVKIILTAIGGQGHIIGRGNQQLTPPVLRRVGLANLLVVATKTKIKALQGRPLLVDSNDVELDQALSGYIRVITGYHDSIVYPIGRSDAVY